MLTDEQVTFLTESRRHGHKARWVYSENHRPMIDELVRAGFMQPAYGEFVMRETPGTSVSVFGKDIPVLGDMVSLYCLTPFGSAALAGKVEG